MPLFCAAGGIRLCTEKAADENQVPAAFVKVFSENYDRMWKSKRRRDSGK